MKRNALSLKHARRALCALGAALAAPALAQDAAVLFVDTATNAPSGAPGRYRALKLFRSRYSPDEYRTLRETREAQERAERVPMRLEGPGVRALFADRAFGDGLSNVLARAVEPAPTDDLYTEFQRVTVDVTRAPAEWTIERTTRRRILTYAGQRKAGDLTFKWNPTLSDFEVVDARVIAPDGTETPVDPALDVFTGDQEWVADAPRYPAGKLVTVSFPKLAPGMSVQWTTRSRMHGDDLFSFSQNLGSLGSFGEISVTVIGTNEIARAFRIEEPYWKTIADRFPVETNAADGATTYLVRGGGPGSQIVSEQNMPPLSRLAPVLRASSQTAPERADAILARMWALSDPRVQTNAAALARSLVPADFDPSATRFVNGDEDPAVIQPGNGPGAAVVAIRDWSAIHLRRAGPSYATLPLSRLSPADETLAARYGHEADLRILQLAMLRALGLRCGVRFYDSDWDAAPSDSIDLGFASAGSFDTIALEVPEPVRFGPGAHGGYVWTLDGGSQYAPPLGSRNAGRSHLAASSVNDPNSAVPPRVVPSLATDRATRGEFRGQGPVFPCENGTESVFEIDLRDDGTATIAAALAGSGTDFEALRKRYEEILPEERRRDAQRLAAGIAQSARLLGEVTTDTPADGPAAQLSFTVEAPDYAVRDGDRLVLRLPGALPLSPETRTRRFPFRRTGDRLELVECRIRPPEGWRIVSAPPPVAYGDRRETVEVSPDGKSAALRTAVPPTKVVYRRETSFDEEGGLLTVRTVRSLGRAEFSSELFREIQVLGLLTRGPDAETVILERASAEAATP